MIEIKEKMIKILGNMKLPPQIHQIIEELYLDYQDSYRKLIEYLKIKYPEKQQEIARLEVVTIEDYKEDMHMVQTIEFEEYEQRRTIIIETINDILKYMKLKKEIPQGQIENNMEDIIKEKENERFTKIVMDNAISEMVSSAKYFINKINNLGIKGDKELETIERQFLEETKTIKEKATTKSPEINQIISEHFKSIYNQLKDVIEIYKNKLVQKEECDVR